MAGFEALNQVLLACHSPHFVELIVVLFLWVLFCSSDLWLALVRVCQRNPSSPQIKTPVAAFDVFNNSITFVLLIISVLPNRCQHELVEVATFIILNFGSYMLGPLRMDIFEALRSPLGISPRRQLLLISGVALLAFVLRLACALFECFPEHDKNYKWRLGFTIAAAVLTYGSGILVDILMIRFQRNFEKEKDPTRQGGGSSYEESHDTSKPDKRKLKDAKRAVMYKAGVGVATVFLSLVLTACFHRNVDFPVIRCICAHNGASTVLRLRKKIVQWWKSGDEVVEELDDDQVPLEPRSAFV